MSEDPTRQTALARTSGASAEVVAALRGLVDELMRCTFLASLDLHFAMGMLTDQDVQGPLTTRTAMTRFNAAISRLDEVVHGLQQIAVSFDAPRSPGSGKEVAAGAVPPGSERAGGNGSRSRRETCRPVG